MFSDVIQICQVHRKFALQDKEIEDMNAREIYIHAVVEIALFFRQIHEENHGGGHSGAIKLLSPWKINAASLRRFVLDELYVKEKLSLTEVVQILAASPLDGMPPEYVIDDIRDELVALCREHERPLQPVNKDDRDELLNRMFFRLSRQIHRIHSGELGAHSRMIELFVSEDLVPRGRGKDGPGHREHVVPCAFLRDASLRKFSEGASIDDIAVWIRPYIVIVDITKTQQRHLDASINKGGCGLKITMPVGWSFHTGCIFDRLHVADIEFDPPEGMPMCDHHSSG